MGLYNGRDVPAEATVKGIHKYLRHTEWDGINRTNANNYHVVTETLKLFRKDFPEDSDLSDADFLAKHDDIWAKGLYDAIVYNSFENKDYMFDRVSKGDDKFPYSEYCEHINNYDVLLDFTFGGYMCQPIVVFGIQQQRTWAAKEVLDEYAGQKLKEMQEWRQTVERDTIKEYQDLEIELYKEGHIKFEIKEYPVKYREHIRWVEHNKTENILHKDIW